MRQNAAFLRIAQITLLVCSPLLLLLSNLYLLATPAFVHYEYGKPQFPAADFYDPAERIFLAEATVHYLRSSAGPDYLKGLRSQERVVYNARETKHLDDVKSVMGVAFWVQGISAVLCVVALAFSWRRSPGKILALQAVYRGCLAFCILLVGIGVVAYTSFDLFFTAFHHLLFKGDTWLFAYSDTLIQLFPVQFWMDAAAALVLPAVAESILVGVVAYILSRRLQVD